MAQAVPRVTAGDRFTIHHGPHVEEVTIRYADDDIIVYVGENGRWGLMKPDVFEHHAAVATPPGSFWLELSYHRENGQWHVVPGPLLDQAPTDHDDRVYERYAVLVSVTGSPIALRHVSRTARADVVPSQET